MIGAHRNDQEFYYTGDASERTQGLPGYAGPQSNTIVNTDIPQVLCDDWSTFWGTCEGRDAIVSTAGSSIADTAPNEPFGLGKATSGEYNTQS